MKSETQINNRIEEIHSKLKELAATRIPKYIQLIIIDLTSELKALKWVLDNDKTYR